MDYKVLGLDDGLTAVDSPAGKPRELTTSLGFDSTMEIPTGGINYTNLTSTARQYTAIVSLSGELGTFKDIQLAINYVNSLGGGSVFIRKGTYILASQITLYSNISLIGEDNSQSIIDFNNTYNDIRAIGTVGSHLRNIKIINLTIQNSTDIDYGALGFKYVDSVYIQNNIFAGNFNSGDGFGITVYLSYCSRGIVQGNYSTTSDQVVYLDHSDTIRVSDNNFNDAQSDSITMISSNGVFIVNNRIVGSGNSGGAVMVDACRSSFIYNNYILNPINSGLYLYTSNGQPAFITIANNVFENSGTSNGDGLKINNAAVLTVVGNVSLSSGTTGVGYNIINADDSTFTGNAAWARTQGFNFGSACDRDVITSNVALLCGTALVNNSTNGTAGFNIVA